MEEPGSRLANPEIIDNGRLKSRFRILLESLLTLTFWTGFLYLLTPLVTIILWAMGFQIAYSQLVGAEGLSVLIKLMAQVGILLFIVGIIIICWGYYNYLIFRIRGERRNSRVLICFDTDFSARYHIDLETLQAAKEEPRLVVTFTDDTLAIQSGAAPVSSLPPELLPKEEYDAIVQPKSMVL